MGKLIVAARERPIRTVRRMRETERVASAATGILTAPTTPEVARRTWPGWLALGLAAIAVAVAALVWAPMGPRLLLAALGAFLVGRGVWLVRSARSLDRDLAGRARVLGTVSAIGGIAALAVGLASAGAAATVLLVAVPVLLILASVALLARGGVGRFAGGALLGFTLLVTALLVVRGVVDGWDGAARLATGAGALAVAVLGVPMLLAAANLRAVANRPAPARPAACAGCACGAGGCGALG
jgi:hypothetical protein